MDDKQVDSKQEEPPAPGAAADTPPAPEAVPGANAGNGGSPQAAETGILARIKKKIDEMTLIAKAMVLLVGAIALLFAKLGIDFLFPGNGVDSSIDISGCNMDRIEFNMLNNSKEKIEIRNIEILTEVGRSRDSSKIVKHFLPADLLEASNRVSGSARLGLSQEIEVFVPLSDYLREPAESRFIDAAAQRAAKKTLVLQLVEGDFFDPLAEDGSSYPYCKVRVKVTVGDRMWWQPSGSCTCKMERFE